MGGKTSWLGKKQIVCREAIVLVAYRDGGTDEEPKYSIAAGSQTGLPKLGDMITLMQAFQILDRDIAERDEQLDRLVKVELPPQQWDALASLHYQAGFIASRQIAGMLNVGLPSLAALTFLDWGFNRLGLKRRREREKAIFEHGDYGDISQFKLYDGNPREVKPVMTDFPTEEEVNSAAQPHN